MRIENFAKLKRCDHSPKWDEFIDVSLDPPYFSLDSPFKQTTEDYSDQQLLKQQPCMLEQNKNAPSLFQLKTGLTSKNKSI
jgi:hypothetical protein